MQLDSIQKHPNCWVLILIVNKYQGCLKPHGRFQFLHPSGHGVCNISTGGHRTLPTSGHTATPRPRLLTSTTLCFWEKRPSHLAQVVCFGLFPKFNKSLETTSSWGVLIALGVLQCYFSLFVDLKPKIPSNPSIRNHERSSHCASSARPRSTNLSLAYHKKPTVKQKNLD